MGDYSFHQQSTNHISLRIFTFVVIKECPQEFPVFKVRSLTIYLGAEYQGVHQFIRCQRVETVSVFFKMVNLMPNRVAHSIFVEAN